MTVTAKFLSHGRGAPPKAIAIAVPSKARCTPFCRLATDWLRPAMLALRPATDWLREARLLLMFVIVEGPKFETARWPPASLVTKLVVPDCAARLAAEVMPGAT